MSPFIFLSFFSFHFGQSAVFPALPLKASPPIPAKLRHLPSTASFRI